MAKKSGIHGAKEVQRALRELARIYGRPVNEASRKALQPIAKAARANSSHATIKKAITIRRNSQAPKDKPEHMVGMNPKHRRAVRLAHLLEFGVSPHAIGGWMHPGHAPQPFLTPAFEQHAQSVIKVFGQEIGPAFERQAERLAKKYGAK